MPNHAASRSEAGPEPTPSNQQTRARGALDLADAFRCHGEALAGRALWLTRNESDAGDLFQRTFLHALGGQRRDIPPERVRAWLSAIMHNAFLDDRRSGASRRLVPLDQAPPERLLADEPETAPDWSTVSSELLARAVQGLPEEMRRVVQLYLQGVSYRNIARRLQLPMGTVATRLMRARRRLGRVLEGAAGR